jgi:predicted transcriptional regulator
MDSLDSHRYYELKILEQVSDGQELPRRVAARKLGVSVKLAHKLLSGLVERGLLHVKKENARRWRYFLTPGGVAEKARLTREFLEFSLEFYREARRRSAQVCRDLSEAGVHRIAFLGLGELAEIAYLGVQEWGLELAEVYDGPRTGRSFFGCRVLPLEAARQSGAEAIVVTSFNPAHPMTPRWLPQAVQADERMVWIFGEEPKKPLTTKDTKSTKQSEAEGTRRNEG